MKIYLADTIQQNYLGYTASSFRHYFYLESYYSIKTKKVDITTWRIYNEDLSGDMDARRQSGGKSLFCKEE